MTAEVRITRRGTRSPAHGCERFARRVSVAASLVLVLAVGSARGASAPQLLGQWHLDQLTAGSPLTTPDSSGHGLTATSSDPSVDPTTVSGRFANGLEFSGPPTGPSPQLSVPKTVVLEPQHVTLMAWVKRVDNSDTGPMWIAGKGSVCITGGLEASWALHSTAQGNISFLVYDGSNIHDSPATTAVPFDGKWHAVAGSFDGTTVRMYLDGKQVGTGTRLRERSPTASTTTRSRSARSTRSSRATRASADPAGPEGSTRCACTTRR